MTGTYMCQGKMPQAVRTRYEQMPESPRRAMMLANFDQAVSHPDAADLARLKEAVAAERYNPPEQPCAPFYRAAPSSYGSSPHCGQAAGDAFFMPARGTALVIRGGLVYTVDIAAIIETGEDHSYGSARQMRSAGHYRRHCRL